MLKVYQIQLNDIEYNLVNEQGWSASPKTKAYADSRFGKLEKINSDNFQYYTYVANVATNDLEEAFHAMNMWDYNLVETVSRPCCSMSVGDILMTEEGDFYMCAPIGFEKVVM